jgi:predicted O-methyltransferase YrrM
MRFSNNFEKNKNWQLNTPVAFLIFNRPNTTQRVFNAIRDARPPKLLVVADGARIDKEGEAELCEQTRAIINQVDWDCEVLVNYSDVNLGCRKRVSSGLDWVFEQVEEAIILEDDCLPHPSFFRFCQELLEKYRDDEQIMVISGNNFQFGVRQTQDSYYFSRYCHIWGWATWRRVWSQYHQSLPTWGNLRQTNWLIDFLKDEKAEKFWSRAFDSVWLGYHDTWDITLVLTLWINNGIGIIPEVNLVSNLGFGSGTHTTKPNSLLAYMPTYAIDFPLQHPKEIIRQIEADNFTEKYILRGEPFQQMNNQQLLKDKHKQLFMVNQGINNDEVWHTFDQLLGLQLLVEVTGDILEIGILRGATISFLATSLQENERAFLIDPYANMGEVKNLIANFCQIDLERILSFQNDSQYVAKRHAHILGNYYPSFKFVHIDGEHSYDAVFSDIALAFKYLADGGLIVLDDIFNVASACCTHAMFDYLKHNPNLHCVAIGFNKAYLCESKALTMYREFFLNLPVLLEEEAGLHIRLCFNSWAYERSYLTFHSVTQGDPKYQAINKLAMSLEEILDYLNLRF